MKMTRFNLAGLLSVSLIFMLGCSVSPQKVTVPVMPNVELNRFMGAWYVIANIPTLLDKDAYNAVESYALNADGTIQTIFTFNKGGFDGEPKRYEPKGFVIPGTQNAIWGMRFVWPVKAEYVISYLDSEYSETIIARSARDYVWIMARSPSISNERYKALLSKVSAMGYDTTQIKLSPQLVTGR